MCCCLAVAMDPVAANVCVSGSYSSAVARTVPPEPIPPVNRTLPSASSVAVWWYLPVPIDPTALKVPVSGSYSSAVARVIHPGPIPPVISTLPSARRVAVCSHRVVDIDPFRRTSPQRDRTAPRRRRRRY